MTQDGIDAQANRPMSPSVGNDRCFWCEELLLENDLVTISKRSGCIDSCSSCAISMGTIMLARGYCRKHEMTFTPSGMNIL